MLYRVKLKLEVVNEVDKRKLTLIIFVVIVVPLFIWIQFFEVPSKVKLGEEKMQQDPETHNFENVVNYESAYMGDASNTNALFNALPLNEKKGTIAMDPDTFLLVVNYDFNTVEHEKEVEQAVLYNTTAAYALIENLQIIEMRFLDKSYTVTRENVEIWFGTTLFDLKDPEVFKERVQDRFKGNIDEWIEAYVENQ